MPPRSSLPVVQNTFNCKFNQTDCPTHSTRSPSPPYCPSYLALKRLLHVSNGTTWNSFLGKTYFCAGEAGYGSRTAHNLFRKTFSTDRPGITRGRHERPVRQCGKKKKRGLKRIRVKSTVQKENELTSERPTLLPPRTSTVTAEELEQSSMTSMRSFVVPKETSRTAPALPSFSAVNSLNGTRKKSEQKNK